ncbi:hypothetical protein [Paenibacillus lutrae]|uniref:hypothetical protein n=1 Tax=Paenibacillus lutrae TaxID=2078573 RepID=UPI001412F02B|nr:hypothetical protein [Paenibacillus lutrae]
MEIDWYKLILWITLAFINIGFAEIKNMNKTFWFIISLIIGPIATIAIVTNKNDNVKGR